MRYDDIGFLERVLGQKWGKRIAVEAKGKAKKSVEPVTAMESREHSALN